MNMEDVLSYDRFTQQRKTRPGVLKRCLGSIVKDQCCCAFFKKFTAASKSNSKLTLFSVSALDTEI
jgi:hypothetical protein